VQDKAAKLAFTAAASITMTMTTELHNKAIQNLQNNINNITNNITLM